MFKKERKRVLRYLPIVYAILLGLGAGFYKLVFPEIPWAYAFAQTFMVTSFIMGGNLFAWLVGLGEKSERKAGIYSFVTVTLAVFIVFTAAIGKFHIIIVLLALLMGIFSGTLAVSTNRDLKKRFLPDNPDVAES